MYYWFGICWSSFALTYAESGFNVIGLDVDTTKINSINLGNSYIKHISNERVYKVIEKSRFKASNDFSLISNQDAIIMCVPTPLTKYREPDLVYIEKTFISITVNKAL